LTQAAKALATVSSCCCTAVALVSLPVTNAPVVADTNLVNT
jgi:hypothetical protein